MRHDPSIDGLRFAGNVLVALFHASMFFDPQTAGPVGKGLWLVSKSAWIVGMTVLCLVSGWCFFNGFEMRSAEVGLRAWWVHKVVRRVGRLLVPYLLWGVVFVLVYRLMGSFSPEAAARVSALGAASVGGCVRNVFNFTIWVLYGPLWYLRALFLCALLSIVWAAAFRLSQRPWGRIGVATVIGVAVTWCVKAAGLHGYGDFIFILFGIGGGVAVACPKATRWIPPFFARFAENSFVAKVLLPTGMFLFVTHLAVNRMILMVVRGWPIGLAYLAVFAGSCAVPILAWHALNKTCPRMLAVFDGRWIVPISCHSSGVGRASRGEGK